MYPVSSWTDYSLFPDIATSRQTRDWFFEISLQALPEDGVTEEDFNKVVEMFSRRLGTELRVVTSIAGKYDSSFIVLNTNPCFVTLTTFQNS